MGRLRPWHVHAGFGLLALVLAGLALSGRPVAADSAVLASSAIAAAVFLGRLATRAPGRRLGWWLMGLGMVTLTGHNLQSLAHVAGGLEPPSGVFAAGLLTGYVLLVSGGALATIPLARHDPGGIIDASIVGLAAASLVWSTLIRPALGPFGAEHLYDFVMILLVSAMAGISVRTTAVARATRGSSGYVLAAVVVTYAGNVAWPLTLGTDGDAASWLDAVWVVAYLAVGAAAAHPAFATLTAAGPRPGRVTGRRLVFLGLALALNPAVAGAQQLLGQEPDVLLLSAGSIALVPLVLARIAVLTRLTSEAERKLTRLATHDELTGLANRRAVVQHLTDLNARLADGRSPGAAVLFLDLDDFKLINDVHGHHTGDRLLVEVARRLRGAVRATDLVGRFGGDEFVLVLEGEPDAARSAGLSSVERALEPAVLLDDLVASSRASIGSAVVRPGDVTDAEQLLSAADASMYRVKRARRAVVTQRGPAAAADALGVG